MRFVPGKPVAEQEQTKLRSRIKRAEKRIAAGKVQHANVNEQEVVARLSKLLK